MIQINDVDTVPRRVNFCWPKQDTRVPESKREKPVIEGFADCEFAFYTQAEAEGFDAQVDAGTMTSKERFEKLVPVIKGLPGDGAHAWIETHRYGSVVRAAIFEDYQLFLAEGRQGNSKKRR